MPVLLREWLPRVSFRNDRPKARLVAEWYEGNATSLIGMYGPPQSCKRKTNNGSWSALMYSALSGVRDSGP
jgi:hypothetical protein